jgi:hypothetical protein
VVVTTVCCVVGTKDMDAIVGGIMLAVVVDRSWGCDVVCLWCDMSSVGDAGAVDKMASGASAVRDFA